MVENKKSIHKVYDFLACLKGHGILYPNNITKKNLSDFEKLCVKTWCNVYQDTNIARRAIGRFLPEIKEKILDIISGPNLKMAIFSGHDSTIAPLLQAFKVFNGEYPNFASNVTFEIYRQTESYYVKMLYNGDAVRIPSCTPVTQDESLCRLSDFFLYMDLLTPKNYEEECKCDQVINPDWDD